MSRFIERMKSLSNPQKQEPSENIKLDDQGMDYTAAAGRQKGLENKIEQLEAQVKQLEQQIDSYRMIGTLVHEFVAMTKYLMKSETTKGSYLLARKEKVTDLLNKNNYETANARLRIWHALGWIDADQGRLTRRMKIDGCEVLVIKINLTIYQTLSEVIKKRIWR